MTVGPLSGYTIGVTADRRADEQMQLLARRGAECLHGPVIKTHPLGSEEDVRAATESLIDSPPNIVVMTTGLGVRAWLEAADALNLGEPLRAVLSTTPVLTRGPKTKGAAVTAGIDVSWNAPNARYDDVIAKLRHDGVSGARIAVQLDGGAATDLCRDIRELGAEVVEVPVYRWSLPSDREPAERLIRAVCERRVDALTFTAKPAVENFLEIADMVGKLDQLERVLQHDVVSFCVGEVCATGFTDHGLPMPLVPERHRLGALVQLVSRYFDGHARTFDLAGKAVRLQGRLAIVSGGEQVMLTDRERAVLNVLIDRPGAVHSKRSLLTTIWSKSESDEHVVEVTVARLRQRLGAAGVGIETVIRRGYRVSAL